MTPVTLDRLWSEEALRERVRALLGPRKLIVVSNREPYMHVENAGDLTLIRPASGVTTALDPVLRACGGTWIAHGAGSGDRETADAQGHLAVPPDRPAYTLRRVWLTKEEEAGYYYGFANEALWPLCHVAYTRPVFRREDWEHYAAVNAKFASAVVEEAGDAPAFVFLQDYHFALLPRLLRQALPNALIAQFWHIPWPNPEAFRICPWKHEILDGLLGNHLLAFHIQYQCNNFIDTVDREIEARPDRERFAISYGQSLTYLRPVPISVDFASLEARGEAPETAALQERLHRRHRLQGKAVALGVDRLDYTKGIPERLRAVDRFLGRHPRFRERFVLLQIAAPSRIHIPEYKRISQEVATLVDEINWRYKTDRWSPIVYINEHLPSDIVAAYYRLADVCLVTSLHDGMNLVAKEFVANRSDRRGVLILSRFTGSSREMEEALLVNPYDVDGMADALAIAFDMSVGEQERRMDRLRSRVREFNVFRWAGTLIEEALRLAPGDRGSGA
ncbi:MAG: trehalose-6-phosphate synthase [Planctomycetes bacterium]|nr:trehalose-6-phosphate synthase [Planctomycetota bacterium]